MAEIGIGIVGGGYMGKAHAVAMSPSRRFSTPTAAPAGNGRRDLEGLGRAVSRGLRLCPRRGDWQELVADEQSKRW